MRPTQSPLLPESPVPELSEARLEAMISHALAHPQTARPEARPIFRLLTFPRMAMGGGAMALAASLALAVVLFHQPQQQAQLATTGAGAVNPDLMPELSDYLIYTSLEPAS